MDLLNRFIPSFDPHSKYPASMESFQAQECPTQCSGEERRSRIVGILSNAMPIAIGSLYFGLAGTVIHYSGRSSSPAQRVVYELEHYAS
jgi:hypothetical protein